MEDSFLLEFSSGHLCVKLLPPRHRRHEDTSSCWCFCEKVLNQDNTHVLGLRRGSTELSLRCVFLPTGCATAPELDSTWDCPIRPTSSQLVSLLSQLVPQDNKAHSAVASMNFRSGVCFCLAVPQLRCYLGLCSLPPASRHAQAVNPRQI